MTVAHEVGADASFNRRPPEELKAAGVEILAVYASGPGKAISKAEWDAYLGAGIALVLVDEHGNQQMLSGPGFGTQIAQEQIGRARALGLPPTRPLYYVAEDPFRLARSDWPAVAARYREICSAHVAAGWVLPGDTTGGSLVGAYGGGALLEHLYGQGLARWLWAVGTWGACPHAALVQDPNTTRSTLGGAIDWDYLPAGVVDCGQYPAPAAASPPRPRQGDEPMFLRRSDGAIILANPDLQTVTGAQWASILDAYKVAAGSAGPVVVNDDSLFATVGASKIDALAAAIKAEIAAIPSGPAGPGLSDADVARIAAAVWAKPLGPLP